MTDLGMALHTTLSFENPFKLVLKELTNLDIGIAIDATTIVRVRIRELNLGLGFQTLDLDIDLFLDDPAVSPEKVHEAVSTAAQKLLSGHLDLLDVAIAGPMSLEKMEFLPEITAPLAIRLPIQDVVQQFNTTDMQNLLSVDSLKELLKKASLDVNVGSEQIQIQSEIVLPALLAIPRQIEFPYKTHLAIGKGNTSAISVEVGNVHISRNDVAIGVATGLSINPINSIPAAEALAMAINPLLASEPKVNFSCRNSP